MSALNMPVEESSVHECGREQGSWEEMGRGRVRTMKILSLFEVIKAKLK